MDQPSISEIRDRPVVQVYVDTEILPLLMFQYSLQERANIDKLDADEEEVQLIRGRTGQFNTPQEFQDIHCVHYISK